MFKFQALKYPLLHTNVTVIYANLYGRNKCKEMNFSEIPIHFLYMWILFHVINLLLVEIEVTK